MCLVTLAMTTFLALDELYDLNRRDMMLTANNYTKGLAFAQLAVVIISTRTKKKSGEVRKGP